MNSKVSAAYEDRYGLRAKMLLRELGGSPEAIFAAYDERLRNPEQVPEWMTSSSLPEWMRVPPPSAEGYAECAYHEIRKEIARRYVQQFNRAEAHAVLKSLYSAAGQAGTLAICDDLAFNSETFADEWSAAHPEEPRLNCYGDGEEYMPW